jgi:GT2 family glycosyltransferase
MADIGLAAISEPVGAGFDLVACVDVLDRVPEREAIRAIRAMVQAVPRVLFAGAAPSAPLPAYAKPTLWWLRRFAEAGLQPDWRYDAGFIAPDAFLAVRNGQAGADIAGFADLLRHRAAGWDLQRRADELAQALQLAEARHADAMRAADALTAELAAVRQERDVILGSTTWRITAPLRSAPVRSVLGWVRRTAAAVPAGDPAPDPGPDPSPEAILPVNQERGTPAGNTPLCIILPVGPTADPRAIAAALEQLDVDSRLCLVETGLLPEAVAPTVGAASGDSRVCFVQAMSRDGVSPRLGMALAQAGNAAYVLVAAHGCILADGALHRIAAEIAAHPNAGLIYADEDCIDAQGRRHDPFLKPAWSIDLAFEQDLVGGFGVFRRALLEGIDAPLAADDGTVQDLGLQVAASHVHHIPAILSHRTGQPPLAPSAAAVQAALAGRQHGPTRPSLIPSPFGRGRGRIRWDLQAPEPLVSLIVPTRDRPELLARCAEGVLHRTDYPALELIIADNGSQEPETHRLLAQLARDPRVRVLPAPGPFNYSAINNAAAAAAAGEVLVLLNNDVDVTGPGWLREMAGHAMRPDVGAVGARLLFGNGTIQHAGVVLGVGEFEGGPGIAGHFGFHAPAAAEGHGGQFVLTREVSAVTGACLALRRSVFQRAGGLDAANLPIALNDVDLCLRIRAMGLRIIWTPFAELHHLESASRGSDQAPGAAERFRRECRYLRDRWGPVLDADPFYNPGFSRADHSFQLAMPPVRSCSGGL